MDPYVFDDALTGSRVTCEYPGLRALEAHSVPKAKPCRSLFFPGCSLINYGLPLVKSVYDLLRGAGEADGASLLCCGKILAYEPDGARVRAAFEAQLVDRLAESGIERIVAACPNCVKALRTCLEADARTAGIQVVPLPLVLAKLGYRIDADTARAMLAADLEAGWPDAAAAVKAGEPLRFMPHDSCPDRDTGEFARGLRELMPPELLAEGAHNRKTSFCCGSLVRAQGKFEAADKQARRHGEEALKARAQGIVTACVSCAYQLTAAQKAVPVYHYLELLYNWRIPWAAADQYMKLRFLFDESLGVVEAAGGDRPFVGLGGDGAAAGTAAGTDAGAAAGTGAGAGRAGAEAQEGGDAR